MAAQRQDAATRPAHVAEQELQDGRGADDLCAVTLLRPADRVTDGAGSLTPGVLRQDLGDLEEELLRRSANLLDHLRRVARVVPLEDLEDRPGMLQGFIARGAVLRRAGALHAVTAVGGSILFRFLGRAGVGPARVVVVA